MVNRRDRELAERLESGLILFDKEKHPLYGVRDPIKRQVLVEQLIESIHRVRYISLIRGRKLSAHRADPESELFDPIKAAIIHKRAGNLDEAFWLVFLLTHFGKHPKVGWRYIREIYGRLGDGKRWDWSHASIDPAGFRKWLADNLETLKSNGSPHGFGNHRKYESLDPYSKNGTGAVVESYIRWVGPPKNHQDLIDEALHQVGSDPRKLFDYLYRSMCAVKRFGRLARFDYLAMIGKLGLAPIEPGSAYIQNATGPLKGMRLLFGKQEEGAISASDLDILLLELDTALGVGMQVLEDALCNWQKSPSVFKSFRG